MNTRFWILILGILFLASCEDESSGDTLTCTRDYDQTALLNNYADNIIKPSYSALASELTELKAAIDKLNEDQNFPALVSARIAYIKVCTTFQHTSQFEFGPAADVALRANLNNFPPNIDAVNANIESGIFEFDTPDANLKYDKGLPVLDYFFYGISHEEFLDDLANNPNIQNYLTAIANDMLSRATQTLNGWDAYTDEFKTNIGTDAGSSLSLLINAWNENYELAKRQKLGDPAGVNSLNIIYPEGVEAAYSNISLDLLKASLEASQDIYEGIAFANSDNGEGLADLLQYVNARKEGSSLHQIITNQFDKTKEALKAIDGALGYMIENENAIVQAAYAEYSGQVINTKTDMPSILCISITYVDNPSDSD